MEERSLGAEQETKDIFSSIKRASLRYSMVCVTEPSAAHQPFPVKIHDMRPMTRHENNTGVCKLACQCIMQCCSGTACEAVDAD